MKIRTVEDIDQFRAHFGLSAAGVLLEPDLDLVETECDYYERKRRDAEVLCALSANVYGPCLDLGTSHGRSAYKLGTNLADRGRVFTVNILPQQLDSTCGKMITHVLQKEQIGAYFREHGVANIDQYYANTARWDMPLEIANLSLVFVDAAHDTEMVLNDSRLIFPRVADGGFIVWHDFSPALRQKWDWINASMLGVERFFAERGLEPEIVHLRNSWTGVWRKHATHPTPASVRVPPERPDVTSPRLSGREAPVMQVLPARSSDSDRSGEDFQRARFLWIYPRYSDERAREEAGWAGRIRALGYRVELFGIPCPEGWWPFPKLNQAWLRQEPALMRAYELVAKTAERGDILVASGGAMVHPEFIAQLPTLNVFLCGDDPESSEILSKPVAPAFDVSITSNVACVDLYRSWGCRHASWVYQAIRPELGDPTLTEERILTETRDLEVVMLCERIYNASDRANRIERLHREFPQAFIRGRGWPGGHVQPAPVYRRAKIGWNLHNSIGPCNTRLVTLPAFGVMQICDNKSNLGQLFKLDEEIVGFDSLEECIDKTRYYLAHDDERRAIAARGWKRAMKDYTEPVQWEKIVNILNPVWREKFVPSCKPRDPAKLCAPLLAY